MADIESLSFVLLIPFCICFVLVFLVCCFADQVKNLCRFPSPIPTNYVAVTPQRRRRTRGRFRTTNAHLDREETRILIRNEEERSRNSSESSTESGSNVLTVIPEHGPLVIRQGQIICPQTILENGNVVRHPSQIYPHALILTPATNISAHAYLSTPSLLQTNISLPVKTMKTSGSLPSITEKVEVKNSGIKAPCDLTEITIDPSEKRRYIRNLPEMISVDLTSKKK